MLTFKNPQIFTGYSHIGTCREFVWFGDEPVTEKPPPAQFLICGLQFEHDLEALMIRKDLFLHTEDGREYIVANFQIINISNLDEIRGVATTCRLLMEEFPEIKTLSTGEKTIISKETHLHAFRAVSALISSAQVKHQVDAKTAGEVINQLAGDIINTPEAVLNLLAIKSFDDYTFSHNINVATLSMLIGHAMGLSKDDLHDLGVGALMHDLGKLRVSPSLLNKQGALSSDEFSEIARHPQLGIDLLRVSRDVSPKVREVILHHHEKFSGKGYPHGQAGEQISVFAKICAIADVFDALTTDRPFRGAMAPHEAVRTLMSGIIDHFDPEILNVFVNRISLYPPGTKVEMDDGTQALVVRANQKSLLRPVVRLDNHKPGTPEYIDLEKDSDRFIRRPLPGCKSKP